jgi:thioredoxin-dependent peroxiredoxin
MARLTSLLRCSLVSLAVAGLALPAAAVLKEGDAAPDFQAQASLAGKAFSYSLREARR